MFVFDPMAAGGRTSGGNAVDEAERLHRLAEQRFLVGDVAGALRAAREAQARCRSLQGLAHALAAYEVHAAAAASRASGRNWYAVLSVGARTSLPSGGVGVSHEDIKRRYRRLCLALHPDKNRSAAADGAFKLLQQAWGALSVRHPPAPRDAAATGVAKPRSAPTPSSPRPRPPESPTPAAKPSNQSRPPPPAASPANNAPKDEKRRAGAGDTSHSRPPPPAAHTPKVERASADTTRHTPASHAKPGNHSRSPPPAASAAQTPKDEGSGTDTHTPRRRQGSRNSRRFPCPAQCVHCGAAFASSTVSVGTWHLHCAACHRYAKVCVRSPSNAEICR